MHNFHLFDFSLGLIVLFLPHFFYFLMNFIPNKLTLQILHLTFNKFANFTFPHFIPNIIILFYSQIIFGKFYTQFFLFFWKIMSLIFVFING